MRKFLAGLFVSLFVAAAFAAPQGGGGLGVDIYYVDIMQIGKSTGSAQLPNLSSLSLSQTTDQTSCNGSVSTVILLEAGQSLNANSAPTAYTPTNGSSIFQLNVFDGKIYPASDPELGATNVFGPGTNPGYPALRVADGIISNGYFSRVCLVPIAVSGTAIDWWNTKEEAPLIPLAINRLKQKGIVCGAVNVKCVFEWVQGEEDEQLGTGQTAYTNSWNTLKANTVAAGFVGHFYISNTETYVNGSTSAAVQAAQRAVVDNSTVFAGANMDTFIGSICGAGANQACRQGDGVHLTDAGSFSTAAARTAAMHAGGF